MLRRVLLSDRSLGRGLWNQAAVTNLISEHQARQRNHAQRLWSLLNLELWHRIWIDGEDWSAIPADLKAGG
jgi:asparagine synthase (glutamine-hydrolysing)